MVKVDLLAEYEEWRSQHRSGWGLTWYLAAELCQRFYASHGIVLQTIFQEGLGYYGIAFVRRPCLRQREQITLGRLTMNGDVENWSTGGPGDHGLELAGRAEAGEPVEPMITEAIAHLDLPAVPSTSHLNCRHKRWGDSAVLVFRLAAALALRHDGRIKICNDPDLLRRDVARLDPHADQSEHPGWTRLEVEGREVVLAGDGRVLRPPGHDSLWERYMRGETEGMLLGWLEGELGLSSKRAGAKEPPWRAEMRACRRCFKQHPEVIYAGPEGEARPLFHEQGDLEADLLFVAEAPNFEDTFYPDKGKMTIEPHPDPTGSWVYRALTEILELTPAEVLFTNAVLCLPAKRGGKHTVKAAMRKACSGHLRRMIEEVNPKVVATLGASALQAVKEIEHHTLKLREAVAAPHDWFGRLLFPLYHPSMLGRVSRPEGQQEADWLALRDVLRHL